MWHNLVQGAVRYHKGIAGWCIEKGAGIAELYGEQRLQMKLGEAVLRMYKAAPRRAKTTIIEGFISNEKLPFNLKTSHQGM